MQSLAIEASRESWPRDLASSASEAGLRIIAANARELSHVLYVTCPPLVKVLGRWGSPKRKHVNMREALLLAQKFKMQSLRSDLNANVGMYVTCPPTAKV